MLKLERNIGQKQGKHLTKKEKKEEKNMNEKYRIEENVVNSKTSSKKGKKSIKRKEKGRWVEKNRWILRKVENRCRKNTKR